MDDELRWIARATGARAIRRGDRIQSLWSGYGEIYRVHLDQRTAIVKSAKPPQRSGVSHQRKCRSYDVELAWYRDYAARCDERCRVPALINGARTDAGWLFILEDLDAAGFAQRHRRKPGPSDVALCLSWLASFHARFLGTKPEGLWATGTYWHLATRPDELAAISDAALREAAPLLDARLRSAHYQTLVHGDAKLANFCFGEGGVAAVDFQYVGAGTGMSDVAYFLGSLSNDGADPDEQRHLDQYFAYLRDALSRSAVELDALETEWRALYPIAAADFYRFLAGWAREHWAHDVHGQDVVADVLRRLT